MKQVVHVRTMERHTCLDRRSQLTATPGSYSIFFTSQCSLCQCSSCLFTLLKNEFLRINVNNFRSKRYLTHAQIAASLVQFHLHSSCSGRKFVCTTNECDGVCSIYGDGHYISFDDKRFEFSGQCEYTLVQVMWQMDVMHLALTEVSAVCIV